MQTCTKCQQDLPLAKFKPLASGKGFYKKCIACSGEKVGSASMPVEGVTTKQVKAKKTPKKILVLRGNLKKKCEELSAVYELIRLVTVQQFWATSIRFAHNLMHSRFKDKKSETIKFIIFFGRYRKFYSSYVPDSSISILFSVKSNSSTLK